ncbi:MAG: SusD/RagB family nutrient-binding outer membrane lipoprotein [Mucilaginibacter sp.]
MMKKRYIILTTVFFALVITSCKKGFLSQEVNPNSPSVASPGALLSGAEVATAYRLNGGAGNQYYQYLSVWMGYATPSGNYVPSPTLEQYSFTNTNFQVFNAIYNNLTNYNAIITQAPNTNYSAIAQIMSALCYQELVDNYNDVPYTQALNSSKYLFPAYDSGQSIYNALETNLDAAIATINASGSGANPGGSDIIFGGNMTNWKKFANTLKLRIAIRQSNITANTAALKTEIAKTASEGYLDNTVFATANPGYSNSDLNGGQQSPFYLYFGYSAASGEQGGHAYYRCSLFYVNFLTPLNDPRLSQAFAPVGSNVVGLPLGGNNGALTNAYTSPYGPGLSIGPTMNATILSGSEACFLLAEGVLSGYITTGTAQDYYQRGITASFVAMGLTAAQAAAYYNQAGVANVNWTASSANYELAIITQKYIANVGFAPFETYNEWRRTGYPNLSGARSIKSGALTAAGVPAPSRIYYPSTEFSTNLASVSAEPAVNPFTSKIFWAK